jgi:methylenetetrahydrofolate reductase (NADPH)
VAELAAGPGFNFSPIERFLKGAQKAGTDAVPSGFDFVGFTVPQSPGGVANLEPGDVLTRVRAADLLGNLDFIPHISCKDHNVDALTASLMSFRAQGIESVLALTGDKPVRSRGVFEVESVGLLQLIRRINDAAYLKAGPGQWDQLTQFFPGAAVSPFKYTEASQMQQYFKMEKKIACGAKFLIPQLGYDWRKSLELMRYLEETGIDIPVLGNVYLLTTTTPAPRLMHDGKLPGCFVSDELLAKLQAESIDEHIERAAQQVAMFKAIGAAGADVGGLPDFDTFVKILSRADEIGADWEKYKDSLCWPGGDRFYLYDEAGQRTALSKPRKKLRQRFFNLTHRLILDPAHTGFKMLRGLLRVTGAGKGKGLVYKSFATMEKTVKYAVFDCEHCGDCHLVENFGYCTLGGCEKGLSNAPCGDSTVDGYCGNNLDRRCTGELVYLAASAEAGGVQRLKETISKPRAVELRNTSSIVNYLFGRDHTKKNPLISIADLIDASHPKTGKVMKEILDLGDEAFEQSVGPIGYIRALIQSQADDGADYIAVNVDALSADDGQLAAKMMTRYVELIRQWGGGVPVCIDSRFEEAISAGLSEWYRTDQPVRPPLLGPITSQTADKIMSMRRERDFGCILLLSEPGADVVDVEEARETARSLYDKAVSQYGFGAEQLFFDAAAVPLMKDEPAAPSRRGHTRAALDTIKMIKSDGALKRCHCLVRASNAVFGLPGRAIGVCRAYVATAMEYGLDAAFVNVAHHYGESPADPRLLELVNSYAEIDGTPGREKQAKERMDRFCVEVRKPRRKPNVPALSKS